MRTSRNDIYSELALARDAPLSLFLADSKAGRRVGKFDDGGERTWGGFRSDVIRDGGMGKLETSSDVFTWGPFCFQAGSELEMEQKYREAGSH